MKRWLTALLLIAGGAHAQGTNDFQSLPNTTDLTTLQAAMNANAQRSDEYAGQQINLYPGDITPGTGASITLDGNTYTLPFQSSGTSPNNWTGQLAINGSPIPNADYTVAMSLIGGKIYIEDAKGHGWFVYDPASNTLSPTSDPGPGGSAPSGASPTSAKTIASTTTNPCPAATASDGSTVMPASATGGYFRTSGTQILDPSGAPFQARGVNMYVEQLANAVPDSKASALLGKFPGANLIRVNVFDTSADTTATLQVYIATLSALGIVTELEYHPYSSTLSGSDLSNVAGWYSNLAAANAGNPDVWFGTQNEPPSDPQQEINTIVGAIRSAGNGTVILVNPRGGTDTSGISLAGMDNVAWDLHYYNWEAGNSTDVGTNQAALGKLVSNAQATAAVPAVIGEYGWACCFGIDPGWQAVVQAVENSGLGSVAWAWTSGGSLPLLLNDPSGIPADGLTEFGNMVAAFTSGSGSSGKGSYNGASYAQQSCVLSNAIYPNATPLAQVQAPAQPPAAQLQTPVASPSPSEPTNVATQPATVSETQASPPPTSPITATTQSTAAQLNAIKQHYMRQLDVLAQQQQSLQSSQGMADALSASRAPTTVDESVSPTTTDDNRHHRHRHHHDNDNDDDDR